MTGTPSWHTTWCNANQPTGGGYPSAYGSCNCGYWAAKDREKAEAARTEEASDG